MTTTATRETQHGATDADDRSTVKNPAGRLRHGTLLRHLGPGTLLCVLAAVASTVVVKAPFVPDAVASPLLVAILLGAVVASLAPLVRGRTGRRLAGTLKRAHPGVAWSAKHVLRAGVVLLGLRLSIPDVLDLGWRGLVVVAVTLATTFSVTLLAGRWMRLPHTVSLLIASGFSVCGAAAASTMASIVPTTETDPVATQPTDTTSRPAATARVSSRELDTAVATTIALVALLGLLVVLIGPWIADLIGMSDASAGLWIGASFPEVAHVAAAAGTISAAALGIATVAKLARVALLAPLVAGVGSVLRRRAGASPAALHASGSHSTNGTTTATEDTARDRRRYGTRAGRAPIVPLFLIGFVACVAIRSLGVLPDKVLTATTNVSTFLLVTAMFGMGMGVSIPELARTARKPVALGALSVITAMVCAGILVMLIG